MAPEARNRRLPSALTEADVTDALARISRRDEALGREAGDVYGTLTWGEGPGVLRLAGVQDWLWYRLPTKYITDEVGYMGRLAETAAVLFDELGLDAYAAVCRSSVTAGVHAAFDRSNGEGFNAMAKAQEGSGISPPDLDDFAWGEVMGMEEASAGHAVEDALEAAIAGGDLVVGGRGWRARQREICASVLDGDHPTDPGQSWRTAVVTERVGVWIEGPSSAPDLGRRRAGVANRLLHPIGPPDDVAGHVAPVTWLLEVFGEEQALTQAGYLNRAFVVDVHGRHPSTDPFSSDKPPRSETDDIVLHRLRSWLEAVGALRKRGKVLRRTRRGEAMAADPVMVWTAFTNRPAPLPWDRFVGEASLLLLVERDDPVLARDLRQAVAADARSMGWRTTVDGVAGSPSEWDVSRAFHETWALMELFGFGAEGGDWRERTVSLTPAGVTTALAILRGAATGPRRRPW